MSTIYQENGYETRDEYLECLACDFGIHMDTVRSIADLPFDAGGGS